MRTRAPWIGLVLASVVVALAFTIPPLLEWNVHARSPRAAESGVLPPLHGFVEVKWFGPGTLPAVLLALLGWRWANELAERWPWRRLLLACYVVGAGWLFSLALVDGEAGLSRVLGNSHEYLQSAREVGHLPSVLAGFTDRIPMSAEDNWPTHVAGHPPGALLFFVLLVRLGLGGDLAAGVVVTAVAATIPVGMLVLLRALAVEDLARRAIPFLVLTPAGVFLAVSADAVFTAVGVWGMAALALAARADREGATAATVGWGGIAGLLLGYGVFLSYGFGLLGFVALAVVVAARSWRPLLMAVPTALAVVAVFAAYGFAWWEAYPVLVERYRDGIASDRPISYWWWANVAALLVSAGPLVGAGVAQAAATARSASRPVVLLVAGGVAGIVAASLSGMSKAEVERIWLIFVPWLLLSCALLPDRWRRWGLALQLAAALLVQHLLYTSW